MRDNGNMVGAVYLDTIGHGLLLNKVTAYRVNGKELDWFKDYLFNRTQIVEIENIRSTPEPIYCGVPQGSILGPLLYIVFFNDLIENINTCVIKYADDTVVYYADSNIDVIEKVLNKEIEAIGEYGSKNELLLNLKKGKTESNVIRNVEAVEVTW